MWTAPFAPPAGVRARTTGQPSCSLSGSSVLPSGLTLQNSSASPLRGLNATLFWQRGAWEEWEAGERARGGEGEGAVLAVGSVR